MYIFNWTANGTLVQHLWKYWVGFTVNTPLHIVVIGHVKCFRVRSSDRATQRIWFTKMDWAQQMDYQFNWLGELKQGDVIWRAGSLNRWDWLGLYFKHFQTFEIILNWQKKTNKHTNLVVIWMKHYFGDFQHIPEKRKKETLECFVDTSPKEKIPLKKYLSQKKKYL